MTGNTTLLEWDDQPATVSITGSTTTYTTDGAYSVHESGDYGPKKFTAWWHRFPLGRGVVSDRKISSHRTLKRALDACEKHARFECRNPTPVPRTRRRRRK